ncbi:DUF2207 domain-containing protein [Radiobacillus deserti]|uniref:DUF2207 domain-containing protein n=1 Tax=Radiobacillus deserti TaxID=2594883 RepID=A0A516KIF3_9BACI|nr:DUF2207 domain-containing protein [Radiobacillus deserti]QDP41172.1 DUF2207 domain-containing protein [Radiobacillus deserti]
MKKWTIVLALVFSILLFIPTKVLAVDYTIEHTKIDAFLQENGDVQVKEQHTYQFDGDFNGITRTLIPKEHSLIENVQAFENNQSLKIKQEENLYKIYRGGSDETITIDLSYTIDNGMEIYTDLGQFYWPFFDSSNESTYENMDIYIHPPQSTDDVLAIGYDEAEGTVQSTKDGMVHFALGEVESEENGDIRVAYDATLFPSATVIEGKTIRDDITAEIEAYEKKMAAYENRQDFLRGFAPYVVGAFAVSLLILLITAWRKRRAILWEVARNSIQHSRLPNQEMSLPATILYMKSMAANGDLLSAALLDLVRKGLVERKNEREFVVVNHSTDYHHEELFIQWLFYKIGKDGRFSLDTLETYTKDKKNHQSYHDHFSKWYKAIKAEIKEHSLVDQKVTLRWTVALGSLLLIAFTILFGVHDLFMWMFFSILLSGFLFIFALIYQPRTLKGARIKYYWDQFSSHYHNMDTKQWNEWMTDEQMQAVIYAIGTNNKGMLKKNETLLHNIPTANDGFHSTSNNDIIFLMLIASTISSNFQEADNTVSAATGGSSVSGGGAGVGGGGGGSGAF